MKTIGYRIMVPVLLLAANLYAQQATPANSPRRMQQAQQRQEKRKTQQDSPSNNRKPAQHWQQELRESDPALYQNLQRMRQEDPAAFAQWLREHMQQQRQAAILDRHPAFREFLAGLPEEQRAALEIELFQFHRSTRRQRETVQAEPGQPQRLRQRIKPETEQFDARTRHFEEEIARVENRLQHLRALLEKRRELAESLPQH